MMVWGYRVWPGILLGSFVVNSWTGLHNPDTVSVHQSCLVAGAIGVGATLQAVIGAALVRRFVATPVTLLRERDVVTFLILGGPIACVISATFGISTLGLLQVLSRESLRYSWLTWWVGDMIGVMIFCPLAMLFLAQPRHLWRARRITVGLPLCITFALVVGIYSRASQWERERAGEEFALQAQTLGRVLQNHMDADLELLRSAQNLFRISDDGYLTTMFQPEKLVSESLAGLPRDGIELEIRDETAALPDRILFQSSRFARARAERTDTSAMPGLVYECGFEVGGHHWQFRAIRPNEYLVAHPSWTAWMVLVRGLVFTSLLGGFLLMLTGRTSRVEGEVAQRTVELSRANELLTIEIKERVAAEEGLRQASVAAQAANRAKSSFLANMSHEIRTPLNAVLGFCDLLASPAPRDITASACIETIRRNASHLLELLNDILDFSKIEHGRMTVSLEAVDLMKLVDEIGQMIRPQAESKGLAFDVACEGDIPPEIISDRLRLRQILLNLLGNAVKFTDTGHVRCRLMSSTGDAKGEFDVRFEVSDTGVGMTPTQINGLFRAFAQVDDSTTRRFGGSGLGLVISQRLAQLLHGSITVESQPGKGSTFTLSIRAQVAQVSCSDQPQQLKRAAQSEVQPVRPRLQGTVLVAEDARDNQRLIRTILESECVSVHLVRNGHEAVEAARAQRFDLILMDVQMPVLDGLAATAAIRETNPHTPIIALTAHASAEAREKCVAAGCDNYLTKPIESGRLLDVITKYLCDQAERQSAGSGIRSTLAGDQRWSGLVNQYIAELPADVRRLLTALSKKDRNELRHLVHQIKGSGGGHGFPVITQLAADAEKALAGADIGDAAPKIQHLIEYMRGVAGYEHQMECAAAA